MIYLCGATNSKEFKNIKELTDPIWKYVDGLIFGYDPKEEFGTDDCFDLLEERKGKGEILNRKWTNDHDLQMNVFLREGPLKPADWFIIRDSMERFNEEWAKELPNLLSSFQMQGIRSVFNYGKGFAFQWNDNMVFQGSPHWGLLGAEGGAIDLKNIYDEDKKEHTWRIRDGEEGGRPIDNKINHEAKYAWVYGRSNHLLLGYEDRQKEYQRAEIIRRQVRELARQNGFEHTIEGLISFMKWIREKDEKNFAAWINSHRVWKNFYRYHLLEEKFERIERSEQKWNYLVK